MMVFMCLLLSIVVNAQDKTSLKDIEELTFFGVDFQNAKVFGANESAEQFKEAFRGINNLFLSEPKKYDTGKAFGAKVTNSLDTSIDLVDGISRANLFTEDENYALSDEQIEEMIARLKVGDAKGYGAVIIAGLLNKARNQGIFNMVVFNIANREIVVNRRFVERAKGFGLRNFWAYPVYRTLGGVRKIK